MIRADFRPRKGQIRTDHEIWKISEGGMPARLASGQSSGSGRLGASDGQQPVSERDLCRRQGQPQQRPPVRLPVVPAEGERDDAKAGQDASSGNAHGCKATEVAVLPWRDYAPYAGSRWGCPPPAQASPSGVVVVCV